MQIGFVGLGIMGRPMANNLIKAGHRLFVYGKRTVPPEIRAGATVCDTLKAVAEAAETIIIMVPDTPDVQDVLFSPDGVAAGLKPGKTVIDMSSISPIETKAFAAEIMQKGCDYLDAPVSGGEVGAKAASLTIMVGGTPSAFDRVKPLFELMGKNITLVGEVGAGQTTKVANQIIVALTIEAVGEALLFASKAGADPGQGARGADGRVRFLAHPRSAWRAHDQAHLRPRLPHRAAPEGSEPRLVRRPGAQPLAAQYRDDAGAVQRRRRIGRQGLGPFRSGAGARTPRPAPGGKGVAPPSLSRIIFRCRPGASRDPPVNRLRSG